MINFHNIIRKNNTLKGTSKLIRSNTIIANFNTKSFTYKKGKNITLHYELDGQRKQTKEQKGSLGSGSFFEGGTDYEAEQGIECFSFIDELELEWKESKKAASEDKKVMLIPEFEASFPTPEWWKKIMINYLLARLQALLLHALQLLLLSQSVFGSSH